MSCSFQPTVAKKNCLTISVIFDYQNIHVSIYTHHTHFNRVAIMSVNF